MELIGAILSMLVGIILIMILLVIIFLIPVFVIGGILDILAPQALEEFLEKVEEKITQAVRGE